MTVGTTAEGEIEGALENSEVGEGVVFPIVEDAPDVRHLHLREFAMTKQRSRKQEGHNSEFRAH